MQQNKDLEKTGVVVESLPNIMFKVKLDQPPVSGQALHHIFFIHAQEVTGRVLSKPSIVMPRLSPTRIMSTPAASWRTAVG